MSDVKFELDPVSKQHIQNIINKKFTILMNYINNEIYKVLLKILQKFPYDVCTIINDYCIETISIDFMTVVEPDIVSKRFNINNININGIQIQSYFKIITNKHYNINSWYLIIDYEQIFERVPFYDCRHKAMEGTIIKNRWSSDMNYHMFFNEFMKHYYNTNNYFYIPPTELNNINCSITNNKFIFTGVGFIMYIAITVIDKEKVKIIIEILKPIIDVVTKKHNIIF